MKSSFYSERDFWDEENDFLVEETDILAYNFQLKRLIKICGKYVAAKRRAQLSPDRAEVVQLGTEITKRLTAFENAEVRVNIVPELRHPLVEHLLESADRRRYYLRVINHNEIEAIRRSEQVALVSVKDLERRYQICLKKRRKKSS